MPIGLHREKQIWMTNTVFRVALKYSLPITCVTIHNRTKEYSNVEFILQFKDIFSYVYGFDKEQWEKNLKKKNNLNLDWQYYIITPSKWSFTFHNIFSKTHLYNLTYVIPRSFLFPFSINTRVHNVTIQPSWNSRIGNK